MPQIQCRIDISFICFFQPGSQKLHQIMAGTAKFVSEHGGQSEFLLKVKQGDNPMFGFLNSDHHLHEYYRYLVQHPELLRPVSGSNAESKSIGGEGLSLLGSAYGTGDEDDDEDNGNVNNNDKEGDLGRLKNVKESLSAPSAHVGEGKSKESGANGLAAMDKVSSSSRFLKGAGSKASKVVSKEPGQLEKKKKIIAGAKEYIPPNKTILPELKDTKAKSKSKSEKEHKDNMVNRPSSRFEPRGSWESVPNKEYGMSADAAAAVVLAATRGTRGIIKQDSNKSSLGLSQRVFSNGGSHGPSMNDNEVVKTKEADVEKGKGVVSLEHKDKDIEERRQVLIDEDGSWIKVAFKVNHSRYQKEKVHEHHEQDRGSSSRDPIGLSRAPNYDQLQGRSKTWQWSQYKQSNQGIKPFNCRFDKNIKINLPLEKQHLKLNKLHTWTQRCSQIYVTGMRSIFNSTSTQHWGNR